ncbi:MAG: hypothetical protein ACOCWJ_01350 [Verrucomicrobiota bacterium]
MSTENKCPDPETISWWVDQEAGDQQETIAEHLRECRKCEQVVHAYQRIDEEVRSVQSGAEPPDLARHIQSRCRSLPPVPQPSTPFPGLFWKAAAALALVMAATALYSSRQNTPAVADGGEAAPQAESAKIAAIEASASAGDTQYATSIEMPNSLGLRHRVQTSLDATDLTPVGGQSLNFRMGTDRAVQPVPRTVRHVWLVPENQWDDVQKYLEEYHPQGEWMKTDEQPVFELSVADTALQALVDKVDRAGAALVSGTPPQPREAASTAFTGRNVGYRMVFISQK